MDPEKTPERPRDGANIAALIFVVLLVAGALWLFNWLSASNETLNCVASGRTNCADLALPDAK